MKHNVLPTPETAEPDTTPNYNIPEIMVLDFDRMLGDVDACMQRFYAAAEAEGINTETIIEARKATEDDGGTFEPLSYLKSRLTRPEQYENFSRNFIFPADPEMPEILYPDAKRFLGLLQYADVPHMIMTYGVSPEWQRLKLAASHYPMGYVITDTPDKGASLQAMRSTEANTQIGTFPMHVAAHGRANYQADRLTFIDDKAKAFATFPDELAYKGYWLQRGDLLPSQQGKVPENVQVIRSLDEIMIGEDGASVLDVVPARNMPYPPRSHRWMHRYGDYVLRPASESYAVYLPQHEGTAMVMNDFGRYASFWVPTQVEAEV